MRNYAIILGNGVIPIHNIIVFESLIYFLRMPLYKKITKNLQKVTIKNQVNNQTIEWINVFDAGKQEIEYLRKKFKFELIHLKASLGKAVSQRPLVEQGNGYLFIILHFPIYNGQNIVASEIDFFIGKDYLVTLHNNNIPIINDFFNFCKKEPKCLINHENESSAVLLYQLLEKLMLGCFPILDQNSIVISNIEDTIFSQQFQNEAVTEILLLRRNIINLRKILQNHKNILKKLIEMEYSLVPESLIKKYYRNLIDYSKRIWEILENQKDMIKIFNDTNESLMKFRLNDIMKTLTIFSVIIFPLTFFAAIFGMNVMDGMPLIHAPGGFWIIVQFMLVICFGMLMFFEKKKWL
jgi:magnesium transporter